jgi:hypothetical protein
MLVCLTVSSDLYEIFNIFNQAHLRDYWTAQKKLEIIFTKSAHDPMWFLFSTLATLL